MTDEDERPDALARLDATARAVSGLRDIHAAEEPLDVVLTRVAGTAAGAIPDADAVTVTVIEEEKPRTAAYTNEDVAALDNLQYEVGDGPCLHSARERRPVRARVVDNPGQWIEFYRLAQHAGIHASLSVPLLVGDPGDKELVGALNVYSYTATAFDPFDVGLMELFSETAGAAISNANRWQQSRDTVGQLERALVSRAEIDAAKGVLMAIYGCTADEAFARLVKESQNRNTKLIDVARTLLTSVQAAPRN